MRNVFSRRQLIRLVPSMFISMMFVSTFAYGQSERSSSDFFHLENIKTVLLNNKDFNQTSFAEMMKRRGKDFRFNDPYLHQVDLKNVKGRGIIFCASESLQVNYLLALFVWKKSELLLLDTKTFGTRSSIDISFRHAIGKRPTEIEIKQRGHRGTGLWSEQTSLWRISEGELRKILDIETLRKRYGSSTSKKITIQRTIQYPPYNTVFSDKEDGKIVVFSRKKTEITSDDETKVKYSSVNEKVFKWNNKKEKYEAEN